jgi:ABC-type uncharacterized transport system permease subunit
MQKRTVRAVLAIAFGLICGILGSVLLPFLLYPLLGDSIIVGILAWWVPFNGGIAFFMLVLWPERKAMPPPFKISVPPEEWGKSPQEAKSRSG